MTEFITHDDDVTRKESQRTSDEAPVAPGRSISVPRIAIGLISLLLIAFCAWSMSQYVQGKDPLAFLGGSAFQTVEERGEGNEGSVQVGIRSSLGKDDVAGMIASLRYEGEDISLKTEDFRVVVRGNGIWVEQVESSDATTMARQTGKRAYALAVLVTLRNAGINSVTWISEDVAGAVRLVACYPTHEVTQYPADTEGLLASASAYAFSGDTYAALGANPPFAQSRGDAPVLPDGNVVSVAQDVTPAGESLVGEETVEDGSRIVLLESSSGTPSGDAPRTEVSAPTGVEADASSRIAVTVTVDASSVGAGSDTVTVALSRDATVYDALLATGANVNAKGTGYGVYVAAIDGIAEREHGSGSGWVYTVNDNRINVACSSYVLSDGDSVHWMYINDEG